MFVRYSIFSKKQKVLGRILKSSEDLPPKNLAIKKPKNWEEIETTLLITLYNICIFSGALESVKYSFIAITPRFTLT